MLVPGGLLVIANYTYLPQHSALARESEALVVKWNPSWKLAGFNGLYSVAGRYRVRRIRRSDCASSSASITTGR